MATTIIDVLQDRLGDLKSFRAETLGKTELDQLGDAVNNLYGSWPPPQPVADEFRLYSGGWIAGNTVIPQARQYLYTTLLYAPSVVIHDPIADWFDPGRDKLHGLPAIRSTRNQLSFVSSEPDLRRNDGYYRQQGDLNRTLALLQAAVPALVELEPLIRKGIVIPIPQWHIVRDRQTPVLSAVRHDVRDDELAALIGTTGPLPRSDQIRGLAVTPPGGVLASDRLRVAVQDPLYFFHKTLAITEATGSRYVPPGTADAALLEYKTEQLAAQLRARQIDLSVVSAIGVTDLPFLTGASASTIVAIRQDEVAFDDWRRELRTIARVIEALPSDGNSFQTEAREVLADALIPRANALRATISTSSVLKNAAASEGLRFAIQAASLTGAGLITGTPLDVTALTALGLSSTASWLFSSIFREKSEGAHGVLATLVADWDQQPPTG